MAYSEHYNFGSLPTLSIYVGSSRKDTGNQSISWLFEIEKIWKVLKYVETFDFQPKPLVVVHSERN